MWTPTTRKQHIRKTNRYQTDVTDKEWRVIEPHLPAANSTGRPRAWPMREIINGIFYVMRSGCPWRLLPSDLPPWGTIYRWFATFRDEDRFEKINHAMVMNDFLRLGEVCFRIFNQRHAGSRQTYCRAEIWHVRTGEI